jgi:hypothetical protein
MKMTEATIRIPGNFDLRKLPEDIIYKSVTIAIELKKKEMKRDLKRLESKIKRFEKKYRMEFPEFEKSMEDSFQAHNDWMDWSFLEETRKQLLNEARNFEIY